MPAAPCGSGGGEFGSNPTLREWRAGIFIYARNVRAEKNLVQDRRRTDMILIKYFCVVAFFLVAMVIVLAALWMRDKEGR
jgi:hypothetical protein